MGGYYSKNNQTDNLNTINQNINNQNINIQNINNKNNSITENHILNIKDETGDCILTVYSKDKININSSFFDYNNQKYKIDNYQNSTGKLFELSTFLH